VAKRRKRRIWSDDEKRMICAQTRVAGVSVSQVARREMRSVAFKKRCPMMMSRMTYLVTTKIANHSLKNPVR